MARSSFVSRHKSVFKGEDGAFIVYTPTSELPSLPLELAGFISQDTWHSRIDTLSLICKRSSRPFWEILWSILAFSLPLILFFLLSKAYSNQTAIKFTDLQAAAVSLAGLTVISITFWAPLFARKYLYARKARLLIANWDRNHVHIKPPLEWKVQLPGICQSRGVIKVYFPPPTTKSTSARFLKERGVAFIPVLPPKALVARERNMFRSLVHSFRSTDHPAFGYY